MARFAPFKTATQAATPSYVQAEIERSRIANQAQQAENARKSQNVMGAGMLYNEAMGDNTPIADYLADALRGGGGDAAFNLGGMEGAALEAPVTDAATGAMNLGDMGAGMDFGGMAAGVPEAAAGMDFAMPALGGADTAATGAMNLGDMAGATGAVDAAGAAADSAGMFGGMSPLTPLMAGAQLAEGDIGGAAGTGAKGYLATLGPYGIGAALVASLLGL